jgi:hypothetical protein
MDANGGTANGIAVDLYDSEARINGVGPGLTASRHAQRVVVR